MHFITPGYFVPNEVFYANQFYFFFVVEAAGGRSLACVVDVRDEDQLRSAVEEAVRTFGGIDILVNNASVIHLTGTSDTPMKKYVNYSSTDIHGKAYWAFSFLAR